MPFTPLHMGPGIVVKACLQGAFSLMVFGWSQILIDIQPLVVMLTDRGELHGFSHTFIGASLIAIIAAPSGKYLGEIGLRIVRMPEYNPISWRVAIISAFIGTYSHVFIDAIMHSDIEPFFPFSNQSTWHGFISIDMLHLLCVASALVGGVAFWLIERIRQRRNDTG
jgi:membrane-bound metal-dependent hydrolase YbcI (DUF457 family)